MAAYFSYFPNVYIGEGVTDDESFKYRKVKNIFRRVKLRDDLKDYVTLLEMYYIEDKMRPSDVAGAFYGDPFLDWVVLLVNNITDPYEQWPVATERLYDYTVTKYGVDNVDSIHHWETNEILFEEEVYVKEGIQVNETFRVTMPDGTILGKTESIYPVSNYEHEEFLNEKKRFIKIATPPVLELILSDFRDKVEYDPHPELDRFGDKKTPLSIASRFIDEVGYVSGSVDITTNIAQVTSFDYGPTSMAAGVATSTTTSGAANTTTTTTPTPTPTPAPTPTPTPTPTPSPSPSGGGGGGYGGY